MDDSIFIQIASYRDVQLVPTLVDLIQKSTRPEMLRIVVCWQHARQETLAEFWRRGFSSWRFETPGDWQIHSMNHGGATLELIDVPHLKSQGVCWARNLIQQQYKGERYTLQLDSHHRFVLGWDRLLIDMLNSLRTESPNPILTTYLPPFDPENDPDARKTVPTIMRFYRFDEAGAVICRSGPVPNFEKCERPVPARFYSAHFAFADGHFVEEIPHDPSFFFHGEEISIAARAFTRGYDLYHPHRLVAWHEYKRKNCPKMWNDHTPEAKERGEIPQDWIALNDRANQRNRALLGMNVNIEAETELGKYDLGSVRTLAQYERYAGVSFAYRGVQRCLLDEEVPPLPTTSPVDSEADWKASLLRSHDVRVCVYLPSLDQNEPKSNALGIPQSTAAARATVCDKSDTALNSKTLDAEALAKQVRGNWLDFRLIFEGPLEKIPAYYVLELLDAEGKVLTRTKSQVPNLP
ncbi:hypothetical protein FAZ69_10500 [Trinickia terrae]|uniref:Glycosyltransferase (GlcNAc) n=1 Tax=Trinickia terrae TaxID=2571161 RepID=A0A4U1I7I7_9BURK|nr:GlcNAc-transferase family protein [Trinickia terrae]TKC89369.1 hypothetical protein FAZ69_10500 [Trinickia terrae]